MLLLPRESIPCSDIYQKVCYWILPRTEQEYTSAEWLLRTEWNSTEWAGRAGDPLLQNSDITFLHLWSGDRLKALEGFDDARYGRWLLMWYLDVDQVVWSYILAIKSRLLHLGSWSSLVWCIVLYITTISWRWPSGAALLLRVLMWFRLNLGWMELGSTDSDKKVQFLEFYGPLLHFSRTLKHQTIIICSK